LLPVALLLIAACATGSRSSTDDESGPANVILVEIENDLARRSSVTVRIISPSGQRVLGTVGPGRTVTLRYQESYVEPSYRLIARLDDGSEKRSREFQLFSGALVRWRLSNDRLSLQRP
jgi:hypothetical protein